MDRVGGGRYGVLKIKLFLEVGITDEKGMFIL
jgi:hypothetical protein